MTAADTCNGPPRRTASAKTPGSLAARDAYTPFPSTNINTTSLPASLFSLLPPPSAVLPPLTSHHHLPSIPPPSLILSRAAHRPSPLSREEHLSISSIFLPFILHSSCRPGIAIQDLSSHTRHDILSLLPPRYLLTTRLPASNSLPYLLPAHQARILPVPALSLQQTFVDPNHRTFFCSTCPWILQVSPIPMDGPRSWRNIISTAPFSSRLRPLPASILFFLSSSS